MKCSEGPRTVQALSKIDNWYDESPYVEILPKGHQNRKNVGRKGGWAEETTDFKTGTRVFLGEGEDYK